MYLSFTTLATVGFGDLSAREPLGRMLSVSEAVTGQLYLVTVVALVATCAGVHQTRNSAQTYTRFVSERTWSSAALAIPGRVSSSTNCAVRSSSCCVRL